MNEEDQMLCAWLKKRNRHIVESNFGDMALREQRITALKHYDVEPEHLDLWVGHLVAWSVHSDLFLYKVQGDGRRTLRDVVREWVIGL